MNNFGPCTQDRPNRKAGCSASCEAWNAVKGERLKSYGRRTELEMPALFCMPLHGAPPGRWATTN